jgi:hypothetical protein
MAAPEIVLGGGKRTPPRSRGVRPFLVAFALVGLALTVAYIVFRRATTYAVPEGNPKGTLRAEGTRLVWDADDVASTLERAGDLWVIRAGGEPYRLGVATGRLLGALAEADDEWHAVLAPEPSGVFSRTRRDASLRWTHRSLADAIPEPHQRELGGMAAGLPTGSYQERVWQQAALDVGRADGDDESPIGGLTSALAFLAPPAAPPKPPAAGRSGQPPPEPTPPRLIVGRSFGPAGAWPPAPVVVSFLRPEGAIAFARVGWGGQLGAVTGVNAEGLFVALNPAAAEGDGAQDGIPITLLARLVLERAHTLDEAVALLDETRPLGAGAFLLVDGPRGTWAIVERSPTSVSVSRGKPRAAIADFLASQEFAKDAENARIKRARRGEARLARLFELLAAPAPAPNAAPADAVLATLRDRRGERGAPLPAWSAQAVGNLAAQHSVIVDVGEMVLWVSDGLGASGAMRAFDLRAELLGEAPRAVTSLAPDPELAADEQAVLASALVELARATRLARRGDWTGASEAAWRSLALAPDLALPHQLLGDAARQADDSARARAHYRRFLELGPPDEGSADAVRAYLGL